MRSEQMNTKPRIYGHLRYLVISIVMCLVLSNCGAEAISNPTLTLAPPTASPTSLPTATSTLIPTETQIPTPEVTLNPVLGLMIPTPLDELVVTKIEVSQKSGWGLENIEGYYFLQIWLNRTNGRAFGSENYDDVKNDLYEVYFITPDGNKIGPRDIGLGYGWEGLMIEVRFPKDLHTINMNWPNMPEIEINF
jgi:hypothetical protein